MNPPVGIRRIQNSGLFPASQRNGYELAVVNIKPAEIDVVRKLGEAAWIIGKRRDLNRKDVLLVRLIVVNPNKECVT